MKKGIVFGLLFVFSVFGGVAFTWRVSYADDIYSQVAKQDSIYQLCLKNKTAAENENVSQIPEYAPDGHTFSDAEKEQIVEQMHQNAGKQCPAMKAELDRLKSFLPAPISSSPKIISQPVSGVIKPQQEVNTSNANVSVYTQPDTSVGTAPDVLTGRIDIIQSHLNIVTKALEAVVTFILLEIIFFVILLVKIIGSNRKK